MKTSFGHNLGQIYGRVLTAGPRPPGLMQRQLSSHHTAKHLYLFPAASDRRLSAARHLDRPLREKWNCWCPPLYFWELCSNCVSAGNPRETSNIQFVCHLKWPQAGWNRKWEGGKMEGREETREGEWASKLIKLLWIKYSVWECNYGKMPDAVSFPTESSRAGAATGVDGCKHGEEGGERTMTQELQRNLL